ncbi:MAG: PKD domain-containing protein, partial [Bacteroidales bacterium]
VEVIVYLLPAVQFTSDTISGCEPLAVTFADSSAPAISTWLWNFGDISSGSNNYSTQQNPTHVYMNAGVYGITLTVTTTNGCTGSYTHQNMIIVLPSPDASFSMYPNVGSSTLNPTITFIDLSTNASTWSWNFGEISSSNNTSNDQNPQHSYESAGIFTVMLVVENPYGCVDSTSNEIWIKQDFAIFFPNAFSPNGDNENNVFYVRGHGIKNLHLIIYDRWGEKVFETTSQKNGWDGTFHGKKLDPGVFVYYLEALFYDESKVVKKGNITLVK